MLVIFLRRIFKLKNLFLRSKLLWLYSFLVMILVTFTPKVVFARMGSSGGHSGGGHSSGGIGGGGGHSFNSSGYSDDSSYSNSSTNIVVFLLLLLAFVLLVLLLSQNLFSCLDFFFCNSLMLMPLVVYTIIHC